MSRWVARVGFSYSKQTVAPALGINKSKSSIFISAMEMLLHCQNDWYLYSIGEILKKKKKNTLKKSTDATQRLQSLTILNNL